MINVSYLPEKDLDFVWADLKPLLLRVLDNTVGEFSINDIYEMIKEHKYQVSIVVEDANKIIGVATTEIVDFPQQRHFHLCHLAGERLDEWLQMMFDHIINGAYNINADYVTCSGRIGWERKLKNWVDHKEVRLYHKIG